MLFARSPRAIQDLHMQMFTPCAYICCARYEGESPKEIRTEPAPPMISFNFLAFFECLLNCAEASARELSNQSATVNRTARELSLDILLEFVTTVRIARFARNDRSASRKISLHSVLLVEHELLRLDADVANDYINVEGSDLARRYFATNICTMCSKRFFEICIFHVCCNISFISAFSS